MSLAVLLQLGDRKASCLGSALSRLQEQLSRLPVPYSRQQEEADEHGLCRCCAALAELTRPFVEEVKGRNGNHAPTAEDEELKAELLMLYVSVPMLWAGLQAQWWDGSRLLIHRL